MENQNVVTEFIPIRRYVDSDNSCLFSSVSYLIDRINFNENSKMIYRLMIADYIQDNNIDEYILGMSKKKYREQIIQPNTWGGAIELNIFSHIFKIQIASMDVQSGRVDIFGELEEYDRRIYVIYNGTHYDPLVMNLYESTSSETDVTIFTPEDYENFVMFKEYVQSFKNKGECINLSNMSNIKCNICTEEFFNNNIALKHGQEYGHWDFKQI
jgi:ubiquitin thioesterase OTU1